MTASSDKIGVGIIGCGHWGPNHIRVFSELDHSRVIACADLSTERLARVQKRFPSVRTTRNYRDLLSDPDIRAVVVATPTATHFELVRDALLSGKHVLVEKPMCRTSDEARELVRIVEESDLVLMVGYVFVFNNGITKLREIIENGELGRIHYLDAVRTNLGPIRGDVNALYDLGTHDISIFNYLLGAAPTQVAAQGRCITQKSIEDVCFSTLHYPCGALGHIHVSWLNPRKVRAITVVGEHKMAQWDDVDPSDTLRIFDKGLDEPPYYDSFGEFQYLLRTADMRVPSIRRSEPLHNQAAAFVDWVLTGVKRGPDVRDGLVVVEVLEAAMASMHDGSSHWPVGNAISAASQIRTIDIGPDRESRPLRIPPRKTEAVVAVGHLGDRHPSLETESGFLA